jgi:hypothetical protein
MRYSPGKMGKAKKEQKTDDSRSILKLAFDAYQRGDSVQARELAQAVLAGKLGRGDEAAAPELAKTLSAEGSTITETPAAVAAELVSRTMPPVKSYWFAAAVALTFLTLVILATVRYRGA